MSSKVDGSKVRFWSLKRDAVAAARAIGWPASEVYPVHTRFCNGYAIHDIASETGFLSREQYGRLAGFGREEDRTMDSCFNRLDACDPACPGWAVFLSDSRGFEVQRCDSCARFRYDEDARKHSETCHECKPLAAEQWEAAGRDAKVAAYQHKPVANYVGHNPYR